MERTERGAPRRPARLIRLAILDDNPFARSPDGTVRSVSATFHRFAESVVAEGPFAPARYLVPVRRLAPGDPGPAHRPVDERLLRVVPTAPFDGIADYVRRAPRLVAANWHRLRLAARWADLVWIKVPASNALPMTVACRLVGTHRFAYVAGSVRQVVEGQPRPIVQRLAAGAAALAYDGVTALLAATGPAVVLDEHLFTSVLDDAEVGPAPAPGSGGPGPGSGRRAPVDRPWRLVWAGRMVPDKGIPLLFAAVSRLRAAGHPCRLVLVGDGPERNALEALARREGLDGAVEWHGYVGDRARYFELLRSGDVFALPSYAEGLPKALVEAMAAGLPVVATAAGNVPRLLAAGELGSLVPIGDEAALTSALERLLADASLRARSRERGLAWARDHTRERQAQRLVEWMRRAFPSLPWPDAPPIAGTGGA